MGRTRTYHPDNQSSVSFAAADVHAPAANTAAVVTYAAIGSAVGTAAVGDQPVPAGFPVPANTSHVIQGLHCTVMADAVIAAASQPDVKIEDGSGTVVFHAFLKPVYEGITSGKAFYELVYNFPKPMRGTAGTALIVTMKANGANTVNRLNVIGHTTELA